MEEYLGENTFLLKDGSKVISNYRLIPVDIVCALCTYLENSSQVTATAVILATGYHYTFPFLAKVI